MMYNLIVTAETGAWEKNEYALPISRFCEYTSEKIKNEFIDLSSQARDKIKSYPTMFAYEKNYGSQAYLGEILSIRNIDKDILIKYELKDNLKLIELNEIINISKPLNIKEWEMNRTHWSIKDVNLYKILRENKLIKSKRYQRRINQSSFDTENEIVISPEVFSKPRVELSPNLVSVMMPFKKEFNQVYEIINETCELIGLECKRVDDIWKDSTIIQDVFNLIYNSEVVIVDLSEHNPNVLYETGIAHTLGKPVIPISNGKGEYPFDLSHHRILNYLPNDQGLKEMKYKLKDRLFTLTT